MRTNEVSQRELVSVLIGTYNGQQFLEETLESVLAQTYRPLEIIVVDDGSTDETWNVLLSFGTRIRAIHQANGGVAAARNSGLREAKGTFIALMDHDDLCEPERIAVQVDFLKLQREVVLCSSDFSAFNQTGVLAHSYCGEYYSQCHSSRGGVLARYPQLGSIDIREWLPEPPAEAVHIRTLLGPVYEELALGNFVHPPTVMFRRTIVNDVGMFDPDARMMCDWDWLVRASRVGHFGFIDRPLLRYRRSDTQLSSSQHQPRTSIDSLHVALKITQRDPALFRRNPSKNKSHIGGMCLDVADANAEERRWYSLRVLLVSVGRYGFISQQSFRTLLKILLPSIMLNRLRNYRERRFRTA